MTDNADKNWNQKEWLRAHASFIVQTRAISQKKNKIIAVQNRMLLFNIMSKKLPLLEIDSSIKFSILQFHSNIVIAACAISQVSISLKIYKYLFMVREYDFY